MARKRFPDFSDIQGGVGMGFADPPYEQEMVEQMRAMGLPLEEVDPSDPTLGVPSGTTVSIPGMGRAPVANDGSASSAPIAQQTAPAIPDATATGGVPMMPETQTGGSTDEIPDEALGVDPETAEANAIVEAAEAGDPQAQEMLAQAARRRLMGGGLF